MGFGIGCIWVGVWRVAANFGSDQDISEIFGSSVAGDGFGFCYLSGGGGACKDFPILLDDLL